MIEVPPPRLKPPEPGIEVRYSVKMQAQRSRDARRVARIGGPCLMLLGIAIVAADVNALRHHAMVHGGSLNGLLISPWFEMPLGLLAIYFGWLLLRGHAVSK